MIMRMIWFKILKMETNPLSQICYTSGMSKFQISGTIVGTGLGLSIG